MSGSSICYLNTDLELASPDDLSALAAALEAQAVVPLHLTRQADGLWYAAFETAEQHGEPEPNIAAMLAVVETLAEPLRAVWAGCVRREFDIGYDCGGGPGPFEHGLSSHLLSRIAAAGASLRLTLYPPESTRGPG